MGDGSQVPFMVRCGLTFDELARAAYASETRGYDEREQFSIYMLNDVRLSNSDRPSVATRRGQMELLRVEQRGDVLTIADIKGQRGRGTSNPVERVGARLYARRTITMNDATVFMLLKRPPAGVRDDKFFAAEGTVVIYDNAGRGPRALKACGIDHHSGQSLSWIFHASET